jgi:acyl-CoA-dependent ceramide synthase
MLLQYQCRIATNYRAGLSINLLLLLALTHAFLPRAREHTRKFFKMSYYDASTQTYTQGWDDAYFVLFWIIVVTGVRVAVMDYLLMPLARLGGVESKKTEIRFAEQGWLVVYYSLFWTLGMVCTLYSNSRPIWTITLSTC